MNEICCCLDVDGFRVQGEFVVRELGWCDRDAKRVGRFHYRPNVPYSRLNNRDRRSVAYVQKHVTGLPYFPGPKERDVHVQDQVKDDIVEIWRKCKTPLARVVAYKGGHVERDLLEDLRIPSVNLETIGCPKYEQCTPLSFDCGCHGQTPHHCSMSECYAFMTWLNTDSKLQ